MNAQPATIPAYILENQQVLKAATGRAALFALLNSPEVAALPRESFDAVRAAYERLRLNYL